MQRRQRGWATAAALLLLIGGAVLLWWAARAPACGADCLDLAPQSQPAVQPGTAAAMDSAFLRYTPGWTVTAAGADPAEPPDPFAGPAGAVTFAYPGGDLYLLLAPGNYWAYLYVTVNGHPANRLPALPGNANSLGQPAGYRTLLAPERAQNETPLGERVSTPQWVLVHSQPPGSPAEVRIEVWRGWGQTPLRGLAVDPPVASGLPAWPGTLALVAGAWLLAWAGWPWLRRMAGQMRWQGPARPTWLNTVWIAPWAATGGVLLIIAGTVLDKWLVCGLGMAVLVAAGVLRPDLWLAALLFGLPFAFGIKLPLLPSRSFDLIDLGVWGGVIVVAAAWMLGTGFSAATAPGRSDAQSPAGAGLAGPVPGGATAGHTATSHTGRNWPLLCLAAVVTWALVAASAAEFTGLALREWRVVLLNPLVFGGLLAVVLAGSPAPQRARQALVFAWLGGATLMAVAGLYGYVAGGPLVSQAEGVRRVQAFYGSANNLGLYLDRTVAVSLALVLFLRSPRERALWGLLAAPQVLAWLLTFSKGSLFLAAPALGAVLLVGGAWLLRQEARSLRPLWVVVGLGLAALVILAPFLGAERFQRLLDFGQGTGFLRIQLWRSAWQMAVDHPWLGVGPDNFLYQYRSGYMLPSAWQEPNLNHPHTLFLDWWTRLGLPGLLLGLAWLGAGLAAVVHWLRCGPERALALGVLAACAAGLAHGLIDVSYALPDLMVVWVFLFGLTTRKEQV